MELAEKLDVLVSLAEGLGIRVRREPLGGEGGGLCTLRGAQVLFIDTMADVGTRYEKTIAALAAMPEIDNHYILPEIRQEIDRLRFRPEDKHASEEQANSHSG